ncbi:MAG: beta-propeller domain-containing protein [Acidimicrobiales bacterium]
MMRTRTPRTGRTAPLTWAAIAAVAVASLAGCVADDPDAAPSTTHSTGTTDGSDATGTTDGSGTTDTTDGAVTDPTVRPTFGRSRLTFFSDCPGLLDYLRTESSARVTAWGLGYGGYPYWRGGPMPMAAAEDAASTVGGMEAPTAVPDTTAAGAGGYSTTNTQEVGVDEGDIVETNGSQVFVASTDGVRVIDVASSRVIDTLDLPDGTHQLLLDGDRLLVITTTWTGVEDTVVSLFDVADPSNASLVRRTHLEGNIVATRAVDGTARLVLSSSIAARLPFVYPDQFGMNEDRALAENRRIIAESSIEEWMPRWFEEGADGSFGSMSASLDCVNVAAPQTFAGLGISWIATVDLHADTSPVGTAGIVSNSDTVYASASNIYLATQPWDWYNPMADVASPSEQPPTLIHQFALGDDGSARWVASGEVPGRLLNQFAMSELDGDLRVASTLDDWTGSGTSESMVTVLRPADGELTRIGQVTGLGTDEQIYAVRFLGTQAYVVTFRQVDPLYVIDLADPTNPTVTGELKIPGYSAYLHPVGDGLLLGVGQDADLSGSTSGTKLSLFDVSDPANPQLLSSLKIGGYSEAEWDHHAFLYWAEDGTIVIPASPWWGSCGFGEACLADQLNRNGAGGVVVAQVQGTQLVGRGVIEQNPTSTDGCWNALQRSLVIGSEIVTVGLDQVQFNDRSTLAVRDSASWGDADQYGCMYYAA